MIDDTFFVLPLLAHSRACQYRASGSARFMMAGDPGVGAGAFT